MIKNLQLFINIKFPPEVCKNTFEFTLMFSRERKKFLFDLSTEKAHPTTYKSVCEKPRIPSLDRQRLSASPNRAKRTLGPR